MSARYRLPGLAVCLILASTILSLAVRAHERDSPKLSLVIGATRTPAAPEGGKPLVSRSGFAVRPPASGANEADRPTEGRWIDVDVTRYRVQLMDGSRVLQTIAPVAVGAQIDTGEYESTQTGLFHIYNMLAGLQYDAPYDAYISDWVGFDPDRANGFHSFLLDAGGNVVDDSTGRVSNGCIRTGAPAAIFDFAEIGMPVFVHT